MPESFNLGEFEELILLSVAALGGDAYGLTVQELLEREAGRSVTLATVHSALYRLEKKGMLRSRMGGATAERGGRSKRMFDITASGHRALDARLIARDRLRSLIPDLGLRSSGRGSS